MLTIENFQRLKGKVIGITGYYVESIKPVVSLSMNGNKDAHLYLIELTNRKQSLIVSLNMESDGVRFSDEDIKELIRQREESICEYSGLPSPKSYESKNQFFG